MRNFLGRKLSHLGSGVSSFLLTLEHKSNAYFFKKFDKFVEVWRFLFTLGSGSGGRFAGGDFCPA
jgi:hypothetical protein